MTVQADTYNVGELKFLLRHYTTLGESKPPRNPELHSHGRQRYGESWWERAATRRADLEVALRWLKERDWRANYAIRAYHIVGLRQREIASYLEVDQSTVSRFCQDGLVLMVAYLNGELARCT